MTVHPTETPHVFVVGYWVNLADQSCDCAAFQLTDKECRHLKAAKQHAAGEVVRFWEQG